MERMFANAFRYFRNKAGLTQAVVARKAGLGRRFPLAKFQNREKNVPCNRRYGKNFFSLFGARYS